MVNTFTREQIEETYMQVDYLRRVRNVSLIDGDTDTYHMARINLNRIYGLLIKHGLYLRYIHREIYNG